MKQKTIKLEVISGNEKLITNIALTGDAGFDKHNVLSKSGELLETFEKMEAERKKEKKLRFNIPKDAEDQRRLLIDLENQVGVPEKIENEKIIVSPYKKL